MTFLFIGIRFSKDDLLSHRQQTSILPSMMEYVDIVSIAPLDPIALHPLQADEVRRVIICVKSRYLTRFHHSSDPKTLGDG